MDGTVGGPSSISHKKRGVSRSSSSDPLNSRLSGTTTWRDEDNSERRLTFVPPSHWLWLKPVSFTQSTYELKPNPLTPSSKLAPKTKVDKKSVYKKMKEHEQGSSRIVPQPSQVINTSVTPQPLERRQEVIGKDEKDMDAYMSRVESRYSCLSDEEIEAAKEMVRRADNLELGQLLDSFMVEVLKDSLETLTKERQLSPDTRDLLASFRQNFMNLQTPCMHQESQKLASLHELGSIEKVAERVVSSHGKYEAAAAALVEKRAKLAALKGEIAALEESITESRETKRRLYEQCRMDEECLKVSRQRTLTLRKVMEEAESRIAEVLSTSTSLQNIDDASQNSNSSAHDTDDGNQKERKVHETYQRG